MLPHLIQQNLHNRLTFQQYLELFKNKILSEGISESNPKSTETLKLNLQRVKRVQQTYKVNEKLYEKIKDIDQPQSWILLTEDWCGDSAQTIPYIASFAELNPLIDLSILLRDENPEIMDLYLTDGTKRSIPKLIAFNLEGNELFQWGARPKEAQALVDKAKADGKTKEQFLTELHLWYSRDKGKSLEEEFIEILENILIPHR